MKSTNKGQQTQLKDLKEIAKNADNLIEILQNIKKTVDPNQNKDENIGNFYPPPSSRLENIIQLETDLDEDLTTNHVEHFENEENKSENANLTSAPHINTQEGWW